MLGDFAGDAMPLDDAITPGGVPRDATDDGNVSTGTIDGTDDVAADLVTDIGSVAATVSFCSPRIVVVVAAVLADVGDSVEVLSLSSLSLLSSSRTTSLRRGGCSCFGAGLAALVADAAASAARRAATKRFFSAIARHSSNNSRATLLFDSTINTCFKSMLEDY
jgi:hypothetical protein